MSLFKRHKTLADLEEEEEQLDTEISVAKKRAMLREVDSRMGKGGWRKFSDNGKKSGINWARVWAWLRSPV